MKYAELKLCKTVRVSDHALERWNKRVGPAISRKEDIEHILSKILMEMDRLEVLNRECICIDGDIIMACSIEGDVLIAESFMGRISMRPSLDNYNALAGYMMREASKKDMRYSSTVKTTSREGISLELTEHELRSTILPEIADEVAVVKIINTMFKLSLVGDRLFIKQITGNRGVGQEVSVEINDLHLLWIKIQGLSHNHLPKLAVAAIEFIQNCKQTKLVV